MKTGVDGMAFKCFLAKCVILDVVIRKTKISVELITLFGVAVNRAWSIKMQFLFQHTSL